MSSHETPWNLIKEALLSGPSDGSEILNAAYSRSPYEALYLATRNSIHAESWRIEFGKQRKSSNAQLTIIEFVVQCISDFCLHSTQQQQPKIQDLDYCLRLIANCCADNNVNRKIVIHGEGFKALMNLLELAYNPNVLIPTLYNVCTGYDEPARNWQSSDLSRNTEAEMVTLAEEYIATDNRTGSIFTGIVKLLSPDVVAKCDPELYNYLSELVQMASRPIAIASSIDVQSGEVSFADALVRLLAEEGGSLLAESSVACRIDICRALLATSFHRDALSILATSGQLFILALMAYVPTGNQKRSDDDQEFLEENTTIFQEVQNATLKLLYEIGQMPEFSNPPKYGIARLSLDLLLERSEQDSNYLRTAALIMLYGFIDCDVRATLVASEGLISPLLTILSQETDKSIIYPAIALASKMAVTWRLRSSLVDSGIIPAVQHMLLAAGIGFEVPLNTIILIELLVKGHKWHMPLLCWPNPTNEHSTSVMEDLTTLFNRGHDAINFEIGRLFIEICSTLSQRLDVENLYQDSSIPSLNSFLEQIDNLQWSKVFIFMATKGQSSGVAAAERVWFALGLLSTSQRGQTIVEKVLADSEVRMQVQDLSQNQATAAWENLRFILHNMEHLSQAGSGALSDDLNNAMTRMHLQ